MRNEHKKNVRHDVSWTHARVTQDMSRVGGSFKEIMFVCADTQDAAATDKRHMCMSSADLGGWPLTRFLVKGLTELEQTPWTRGEYLPEAHNAPG